MEALFNSRFLNPVFRGIGGLCFEIYLVQYTLFHNVQLPISYPFNILIMWILILIWAYVLHIFSNFFKQTIREDNYDWRNIFSIY